MLFEAKNISFGYDRNKLILDHVSLGLEAGERVGLIGPSGCGKSTLAQILSGYIAPCTAGKNKGYTGEVLFDGQPLSVNGYREGYCKGYCPVQLVYQHPEKAVNPRWKMGRTLREAWEPNGEFLKDMGIEHEWLDRYPQELSGGEIQRFCIARALGPQTKIILADEMSTMLDVITQAQIWEVMLRAVEKRGLGLLVVTHNPHLAEKVCTRIIKFDELFQATLPA
ncbi:peptide ABC transporter [Spirochaetia bacterium]|nr:peptide ABC transporter [Spirochaetia bacterium]